MLLQRLQSPVNALPKELKHGVRVSRACGGKGPISRNVGKDAALGLAVFVVLEFEPTQDDGSFDNAVVGAVQTRDRCERRNAFRDGTDRVVTELAYLSLERPGKLLQNEPSLEFIECIADRSSDSPSALAEHMMISLRGKALNQRD